jgi:hypothetical protein
MWSSCLACWSRGRPPIKFGTEARVPTKWPIPFKLAHSARFFIDIQVELSSPRELIYAYIGWRAQHFCWRARVWYRRADAITDARAESLTRGNLMLTRGMCAATDHWRALDMRICVMIVFNPNLEWHSQPSLTEHLTSLTTYSLIYGCSTGISLKFHWGCD